MLQSVKRLQVVKITQAECTSMGNERAQISNIDQYSQYVTDISCFSVYILNVPTAA